MKVWASVGFCGTSRITIRFDISRLAVAVDGPGFRDVGGFARAGLSLVSFVSSPRWQWSGGGRRRNHDAADLSERHETTGSAVLYLHRSGSSRSAKLPACSQRPEISTPINLKGRHLPS